MASNQKAELRRKVATVITELTAAERCSADIAICEAVLASRVFAESEQVLSYAALWDEPSMQQVHDHVKALGKRLFLPRVNAENASLSYHLWIPGEALSKGYGGVEEPAETVSPERKPSLVLVPGRAFTRVGARLGRGRGCYDRVLPDLSRFAATVGVAYECQVVDALPREPHDCGVRFLATEGGMFRCEGGPI